MRRAVRAMDETRRGSCALGPLLPNSRAAERRRARRQGKIIHLSGLTIYHWKQDPPSNFAHQVILAVRDLTL